MVTNKSINIQKLDFGYKSRNLFHDFTLRLSPGLIHCIVGKKNEGKTTLLKLLAGQLFPQSGKLEVTDLVPGKRSIEVLQNIFYVPQEIVLPAISTESFESIYAPFYPRYNSDNFYKYLNDYTLDSHTDNLDILPEGEKRKFLLAFAIASNASVLLLDEPTTGMDDAGIHTTGRLLKREINRKKCILIGTERAADMTDIAENIFVTDNHQLVFNQQLMTIQEKLFFGSCPDKPDSAGLLYSEERRKGFCFIREKQDTDPVTFDCELLFNSLIQENQRVKIAAVFPDTDNSEKSASAVITL